MCIVSFGVRRRFSSGSCAACAEMHLMKNTIISSWSYRCRYRQHHRHHRCRRHRRIRHMHHNYQCRHPLSNICPVADYSPIVFKSMATNILLTASNIGDGDSCATSNSEARDEELFQAAISHALAESMRDATEEAISHKSCSEPKKEIKKKKMTSTMSGTGNPAKKTKVETLFKPAPETDEPLQCIFVEGECIPLWPQYVHKGAQSPFIRVDGQQSWMLQLTVALKKCVLQGYEPQKHSENKQPCTKKLVTPLCDSLLHEFRQALVEAGTPTCQKLPDVLPIRMHNCELIASTNSNHFHICADKKTAHWIRTALRQTVADYLDIEMRAMGHIASKPDDDESFSISKMRNVVRDKIHWRPETDSWGLKFTGTSGADRVFCSNHGISLTVPPCLKNGNFTDAREQAFRNACLVWNAVDVSGKKRIAVPAQDEKIQMVPVVKETAMSHTELTSDSESCIGPLTEF